MKTRLNLSIDTDLVKKMKAYALQKQTSISDLVDQFFRSVIKNRKRKSVVDLVEALDVASMPQSADLKEMFYLDQSAKYGFK